MSVVGNFKGAARRLEDIDLPRIAHRIGVGEDELHAVIETETSGTGFDKLGRPKMLFEPHVFFRNLDGSERKEAVAAGLAYEKWGTQKYPSDSYGRLAEAMEINETAALRSASWGLGQILGENHIAAGYRTPQEMVLHFMEDEENHLDAMVNFIIANKLDDDLRVLAALNRPTYSSDCVPFVRVYNGPGYAKNGYHTKMAKAHNKWRGIKDTPFVPEGMSKIDRYKALQRELAAAGLYKGRIDGIWGTGSQSALDAWTATHGRITTLLENEAA